MAFETSSTFMSVRMSSSETKLKEKFALFLAFREGSSIFSARELS